MSRPETLADLPDERRRVQLAVFNTNEFIGNVAVTRAYAAFCEAVTKDRGTPVPSYGHVTLYRPATPEELDAALKSAQSSWDHAQKQYDKLMAGEVFEHDYLRRYAENHAKAEGLPLPVDAETTV